MSESRADLIVVGGGVAGLRAAIEAAGAGLRVVLAAKDPPADTNTDKAQGGIAAAIGEEDRVDLHYRDTIEAGAGLCDARAVRILVDEAPARIEDLLGWGVRFDRTDGKLSLTREAAHSASRVLHAGGDATGREILRALLEKALSSPAISWAKGTFVVDLLVEEGRCAGALCLDAVRGVPFPMRGRVLLATGGCGQVYRETTNPPQATGDGIAIAWRAGAWVRDMEFVQFHPTALALPGAPRFLLSEALRGEGGTLEDLGGCRFMQAVDPGRAELAPRDVVSRAMAGRMAETGASHLLLNVTSLDGAYLKGRFPSIYATCLAYGLDITKDPIPVSPCAHYMMGGVATDLHGRTSVPGLYAAGEAACTGVHGANRLASNSLLEGLVYGARAGSAVALDAREEPAWFALPGVSGTEERLQPPGWPAALPEDRAAGVAAGVREIAWSEVGLMRDAAGLRRAAERLGDLLAGAGDARITRAGVEARNLHLVAWLVAHAAEARRESRGSHNRADHPDRQDGRLKRSVLIRRSGEMRTMEPGAPG